MKYSILITYYQGGNLVKTALTLLCESLGSRRDVEIVISSDNPKEDISFFETMDSLHRIRTLNTSQNGGYSVALNRAAKMASGDIFILMDADIFVTPNWLQALEKVYNLYTNVGCVSSTILSLNNGSVVHWGLSLVGVEVLKPFRDGLLPQKLKSTITEFSLLTSGCLMVSRDTFNKVGGMDPAFYNGFCDLDFTAKISKCNYKNYVTTDSIVYHRGKIAGQIRVMGEEDTRALFFSKWSRDLSADGESVYCQLLSYADCVFARNYIFFNFSKSLYLQQYMDCIQRKCNCNFCDIYDFKNITLPVILEDICPWNICVENTPHIYFCDNAFVLTQNKHWFFHRKNKGDLIIDRNGNVIKTDSLV